MRRENNALSAREKHLVNVALDAMRKEVDANRPTVAEVAAKLTDKLGFTVGSSSVVTACEAICFTWPRGHKKLPEMREQSPRFGGSVYLRLKTLENVVEHLCRELGVDIRDVNATEKGS